MDATAAVDALALSRQLIRCPSVTPTDAGALDVLQAALAALGFRCHRLKFAAPGTPDVDNLYARHGSAAPNFCFAGHTDVVPVGDRAGWTVDPFAAVVQDGRLFGRGAADMKSAIACFVAAAQRTIAAHGGRLPGSISLLITGDEEGPAINGTAKVLRWMAEQGERIDACVVGEPTNPTRLGEMVKIGRRGSLTGRLTVLGTSGHVAYPHFADNPIPRLMRVLGALDARELDRGNAHFQASNLEITTIDVGNSATNVIPAEAKATFNIRYNTEQTGAALEAWIRQTCDALGGTCRLDIEHGSDPFLTAPGPLSDALSAAIEAVTGRRPELSTTGGTSDARFIKNYCPVAEFGLASQSMHKVDEHVPLADLAALTDIYARLLDRWFAR
ncbi:MAG TPA: succinyl-diaminopimelate desuccinylase [Candidatus Sulfotelmatobacter sp.]|nr:succinyl-diaminopimelate desuccinylase [Candidatus Sulfotelmatobacter sp.]